MKLRASRNNTQMALRALTGPFRGGRTTSQLHRRKAIRFQGEKLNWRILKAIVLKTEVKTTDVKTPSRRTNGTRRVTWPAKSDQSHDLKIDRFHFTWPPKPTSPSAMVSWHQKWWENGHNATEKKCNWISWWMMPGFLVIDITSKPELKGRSSGLYEC